MANLQALDGREGEKGEKGVVGITGADGKKVRIRSLVLRIHKPEF